METLINRILLLLQNYSRIEVYSYEDAVFAEGDYNDLSLILNTSSIHTEWDLQVYQGQKRIFDPKVLEKIEHWIYNYAICEINNAGYAFTYQDQLHATSLIYKS